MKLPGHGGTVRSSLSTSLIDWAIIIWQSSMNNFIVYSLLFLWKAVSKVVFFSWFLWGSLFCPRALDFTQLSSVPENYSSFTDVQHLKKKFSSAKQNVQPNAYDESWPASFLWKQTSWTHLRTFAFPLPFAYGSSLLMLFITFWVTDGWWVCVGNAMKNKAQYTVNAS